MIDAHNPTLIFTIVDKQRHVGKYGINALAAEDYTYMLMIERFNYFLGRQGEIGLIVSDDQKAARTPSVAPMRNTEAMAPAMPGSST